jgi:uncharacterized protein DUF4412
MRNVTIVCVVWILMTAGSLGAQGILLVEQETRDGKTSTSQIQIDNTHIRVESHASGNTAFIFDGSAQVMRVIDLDKKTFTEMDQDRLQQMRQQMARMEEQMKNLPPQQRAMMEQMMRSRGGTMGAQQAKTEYRQAGSDKVGRWTCTRFEGFVAQQKVAELCTVDPKDLGLVASDFDVARQLAEFVRTLMPQMSAQTSVYGTPAEQGFSGVAVRRTAYNNGQISSVSELKELRRETFPASTWEVPAGFDKQSMGGRP